MKLYLLLPFLLGLAKALISCNEKPSQDQVCLDKSENPRNYVLTVDADIKIMDIIEVSEADKSITIFMYIMIYWHNSAYGVTGINGRTNNSDSVEIPLDDYDKIIRPSLMFMNTYEVEKIKMLGSDSFNYFWFYDEWSRFEYAEYLKIKLGCNLNFDIFPFDNHECDLKYFCPSYDSGMLGFNLPTIYTVLK